MTQIFKIRKFWPIYMVVFLMMSCASRKEVVYLQDVGNFETQVDNNKSATKFKVDDLVSIHVSSLNPEISAPFNLYGGPSTGAMKTDQVSYLVDQDGMIDFPVIGKIKIEGLSPDELRVLLRQKLSDYLKDPIINIRLINFTVTILGQVGRPGTYPVNGEQISILEALGMAGDLTLRAKRDNILVMRDFNGTKVYSRLDLTSKNVVKSPVFYLSQNDVVYVEPNKVGIRDTSLGSSTSLTWAILSTVITTSALLITRL